MELSIAVAALAVVLLGTAAAGTVAYRRRLRTSLDALLRVRDERQARQDAEQALEHERTRVELLEAELARLKREIRRSREIDDIRTLVEQRVPANARLIVVSKGDPELVDLGGRPAWHFPQGENGTWAGHHPADSDEAIRHLEELRAKGGRFLVIPSTAFWWFDHYRELRHYLEERYRLVERNDDACAIFDLSATVRSGCSPRKGAETPRPPSPAARGSSGRS